MRLKNCVVILLAGFGERFIHFLAISIICSFRDGGYVLSLAAVVKCNVELKWIMLHTIVIGWENAELESNRPDSRCVEPFAFYFLAYRENQLLSRIIERDRLPYLIGADRCHCVVVGH